MEHLDHYRLFGDLLGFPDENLKEKLQELIAVLRSDYPDAVAALERFGNLMPFDDRRTVEELYIRSFDVQAITTMDVGYILFGDDYKRGELLSNLNHEHNAVGNNCHDELADHLPNVLRLLPKLNDDDLLNDLVKDLTAPAVLIMLSEFLPDRISAKNKSYQKHYRTLIEDATTEQDKITVYKYVLIALYSVLDFDFELPDIDTKDVTDCDFLRSLNSENEIEELALQPNYVKGGCGECS